MYLYYDYNQTNILSGVSGFKDNGDLRCVVQGRTNVHFDTQLRTHIYRIWGSSYIVIMIQFKDVPDEYFEIVYIQTQVCKYDV